MTSPTKRPLAPWASHKKTSPCWVRSKRQRKAAWIKTSQGRRRKNSRGKKRAPRRGALEKTEAVASFNATAWKAVRQAIVDGNLLARLNLVQEHHLDEEGCQDARKLAQKHNWVLDFAPARRNPTGGTTGGVGIVAAEGLTIRRLDEKSVGDLVGDLDFCPERIQGWETKGWTKGGFLVFSVYLKTGTDAETLDENEALLEDLGRILRALGRPFLLAGDWQCAPEALNKNWLAAINAKNVASGQATCLTWMTCTEIDFFVVSWDLEPFVGNAEVDEDFEVRPHRCVRLRGNQLPGQRRLRVIRRPKAIPVELPHGPLKAPLCWEDLRGETANLQSRKHTAALTGRVLSRIEEELLNQRDLEEDDAFRGRAKGPRFVWKTVAPEMARGRAKVKADQCQWRRLADKIVEWKHLGAKAAEQEGEKAKRTKKQANDIRIKLLRWQPPFKKQSETQKAEWGEWRRQVRKLHAASEAGVAQLVAWLREKAAKVEAAEARKRESSWTDFSRKMVEEEGGKAAFRWIKESPPWSQPTAASETAHGEIADIKEGENKEAKNW